MPQFPRFTFISNPDAGLAESVLETTPPFFVGKVYAIPKRHTERVEQMMADMANDRTPAAKVPGYTAFLVPGGSLTGERLEPDELKETLRDMAHFYGSVGVVRNKHKFRQCQEDVPDNIDEINGRKITEAKAEGRKIFLEKK